MTHIPVVSLDEASPLIELPDWYTLRHFGTVAEPFAAMATTETAILAIGGLVGVMMVISGGVKIAGTEFHRTQFEQFGYPQWFIAVSGIVELIGGVGVLVGLVFAPLLAVLGGFLIIATMIGAILSHLVRVDDPLSASVPAAVFLVAGLVVTISQLVRF